MGELDFISWLRSRAPAHPRVAVGIGDDAAVLTPGSRETLVTVDMLTDQVDFKLAEVDPQRVGRKALAVNLSDIAAMAGQPLAAFVALVLPRSGGDALARELLAGMLPLAAEFGVSIAGGDTNSWDGPLALSVTLVGEATGRGPLTRQGAQPGDRILVTGELGGSILARHFDFTPRIREAQALHAAYELHAGIDVSDGLALDLSRLAEESGLGAVVDLGRVPVSAAAHELAAGEGAPGRTALEHALGDGEDFELILAVPPEVAKRIIAEPPHDVRMTDIGEFVADRGLWRRDADGKRSPLARTGWEHALAHE